MEGQAALFKDVKVVKDFFKRLWKCSKVKDVKESEQLNVIPDPRLNPFLEREMLQRSNHKFGIWMVD